MTRTRSIVARALVALVPLAAAATALAAPSPPWKVEGKLYGKPEEGGKKAKDVSGLACAPAEAAARLCVIVDDESQGAQVVIITQGQLLAGERIPLIDDQFGGEPVELDAEGVAYADGFFYVVGSHGRPRREQGDSAEEIEARVVASRHLYRIDLSGAEVDFATGELGHAPVIKESAPLKPYFDADPLLAAADIPLEQKGLTIEGVAVMGETLTLGFRGPPATDAGIVLNIPWRTLFEDQPGQAALRLLPLGRDASGEQRGVRDLAVVAGGYVGIAGPVTDPTDSKTYAIRRGDYAVFWWDGRDKIGLHELDGYGVEVKPEAIMPLEQDAGKLRALLLFDGPKDGDPTQIEIAVPRT